MRFHAGINLHTHMKNKSYSYNLNLERSVSFLKNLKICQNGKARVCVISQNFEFGNSKMFRMKKSLQFLCYVMVLRFWHR